MKGVYKVLIVTILFLLIIFGILLIAQTQPNKESRKCETLIKNGENDKIDMVFLTDNVPKEKVKEYYEFMLKTAPFNANKEKFNFFYAGKAKCKVIQNEILFCYSRDLLRKSSTCPNDYIVILSNMPSRIRSSAYTNVMSININHPPTVLLHEFGHAFANLADEYVPSVIPRGAKNCQRTCEKFKGYEGCFQGCSEAIYYRSSTISVMRTLKTAEYKKLDTQIINKNLEQYE
jgi:hypothetical protein